MPPHNDPETSQEALINASESNLGADEDLPTRISHRSKHSNSFNEDFDGGIARPRAASSWSELSHPAARWEKDGQFLIPCECYQRMPRWKKCGCISLIVLLIGFLVMIPVTFAVIVPNMIDEAVKHSTTVLIRATVSNPVGNTVQLTTHLQLNNAGGVGAEISSFNVQLYSDERYPFGNMVMPDITVEANTPADIYINKTLTVTNATAFAAATTEVLQGPCDPEIAAECAWHAVGKPKVKIHLLGIPLTYSADFEGMIPMPLTQLAKAQGDNVQITKGEKNTVYASAEATFFSQSLLELVNLGPMVFEITDLNGFYLGNASMPNFEIRRGFNKLSACNTVLVQTPQNRNALRTFLSGVSMGTDQEVILHGPIDGCPLFMQKITTQNFTIKGVSDLRASPIRQSLLATKEAEGHTMTGGSCLPVAGLDCIRGSIDVILSPMNFVDITFTNLSLNAYLTEEIEYTFKHPLLKPDGLYCPPTIQFVNQYTRPGMYIDEPSRSDIFLPANTSLSVFTPAQDIRPSVPVDPDPTPCTSLGVFGSPYSCCFTSRQLATSCRAKQRGGWSFDTFINGSVVMSVGDFSMEIDVHQPLVTVYFEDSFTTSFEHGLLNCDNIIWPTAAPTTAPTKALATKAPSAAPTSKTEINVEPL